MMAVTRVLTLLCVFGLAVAGQHDIYKGYTVHGVVIRDVTDQELLHSLEGPLELDVLEHGAPQLRDAAVMVKPQRSREFLNALDRRGVAHYLKVADVVKELEDFDEEMAKYQASRQGRAAIPYDDYPRYAQVDAYLEKVAAEHPDIVTLVTAGNSHDGLPIKYLKISTTNFEDSSKPIYMMDAMIHAREWVTTPVALYAIHRLVEDLRSEDRDLLETVDWIIYPMVNPDGYEFTHTNERLWRRTRSINPVDASWCLGVDGNRNFDVAFNTVGVSNDPCSQTYPGVTPFSEPETAYIRDILHENIDRIQLYMNIHSHGNWILYGYGFNSTLPPNAAQIHHVGAVMGATIDAMKLPQAPFYRVGNSAFLLYATSGSAQDYAQEIGIPFSYTLELPGYGFQFQVPPRFIGHINEETWQGIAASARLARIYYRARDN